MPSSSAQIREANSPAYAEDSPDRAEAAKPSTRSVSPSMLPPPGRMERQVQTHLPEAHDMQRTAPQSALTTWALQMGFSKVLVYS